MRPNEKVTISWLDPGLVDALFAVSMVELYGRRGDRIRNVIRVHAGGLLSKARNEMVATFMDDSDGSDWLLMIDSDEQISVAQFDKLIATADAQKRPVVGALVFAAWTGRDIYPTPVPAAYRLNENRVTYEPIYDYPHDTRIQVDVAGTGCLLVHRSVLQTIRDGATEHEGPNFCWFNDLPVAGHWYGEDVYFCRRVKSLGYPIFVHTGVILPHHKTYWLAEEHFRRGQDRERAVPFTGDQETR